MELGTGGSGVEHQLTILVGDGRLGAGRRCRRRLSAQCLHRSELRPRLRGLIIRDLVCRNIERSLAEIYILKDVGAALRRILSGN